MSEQEALYVCESCGHTTPVEGEICPDCSGKMVLYDDKVEPKYEDLDDEELDSDIGMVEDPAEVGTQSLEDLANKEQEESDEEYRMDTLGDDDE